MNLVEIATLIMGIILIGGFIYWYWTTGYNYTNGGISTIKRFVDWVKWEFDNPMARQVKFYLREFCKQPSVTYFMFGVIFEAVGLGVQGMFGMDTYPLLDFLVAGIIATALYVYQNRGVKNVKLA